MRVEHYDFGQIIITGQHYSKDVIIWPERVYSPWWRKEGHCLYLEDLQDLLQTPPKKLIIGTGYYGRMRVPQDTLDALHAQGIETYVGKTGDAVTELNRLGQEAARIVAAFHLTC